MVRSIQWDKSHKARGTSTTASKTQEVIGLEKSSLKDIQKHKELNARCSKTSANHSQLLVLKGEAPWYNGTRQMRGFSSGRVKMQEIVEYPFFSNTPICGGDIARRPGLKHGTQFTS